VSTTTLHHNRLRECRERRKLKQIELAAQSEVSLSTVSRAENWGFRVSTVTAKRLAAALGVEVSVAFPYLTETGAK